MQMTLEPVTLLIGKNNSGKTNICQALRFLSVAASEDSLDEAARRLRIPPLEVATRYLPDEPVELEIDVQITSGDDTLNYRYGLVIASHDIGNQPGHVLNVLGERLSVEVEGNEWSLIEREGAKVGLLHETRALKGLPDHTVETTAPPRQTMLARLYDLEDNPKANAFRQYLVSWRYYSISPDVIRNSRNASYDAFLAEDAMNLASVLFTVKNEDTRSFNRLIELVQEIEPSLGTFNFVRPRQEEVYWEVEDTEGNRYTPESLSDGTLNYIALCYVAMHGSVRTARDAARPGLVIFEEPERGLHVGHLRRLADVLQETSRTQQVVLTTHNPYLIDLFEQNREQVRTVTRASRALRDGTTVSVPDPSRLDSLLESFSLGEMYYRELLQ